MRKAPLILTDGTVIGQAWLATSLFGRLRGLLGHASLPEGELMLLGPCCSIHTVGMRFAVDVLFLDQAWRVIGLRRGLRPGRMAFGGWGAVRTIEAQTGWLDLARLRGSQFAPPPLAPAGH